jgi:DNA-binding CsgD family transcriptional regulator
VEEIFISLSVSTKVAIDPPSRKSSERTEERGTVNRGAYAALVVIDSNRRVRYCTSHGTIDEELLRLVREDRTALRDDVETLVRSLISECTCDPCVADCERFRIAALGDGYVLRLFPLVGGDDRLFALSLEADGTRNGLTRAARRFQLTRRESEVLALILEGFSASEIGRTLHIAENTVQGYFKRLLSKTNSRNRPAMVANVLDWNRSLGIRRRAVREGDGA